MSLPIMVDCIAANIPAVKTSRWARNPAQLYVTGGWPIEASEPEILSFPRHIRTAQQPWAAIDEATIARELDVERYAATPADWPVFYASRRRKDQATVYTSILGSRQNGGVAAVLAACATAGVASPVRWRIAWWLHNQPGVPLPDDEIVTPPTLEQVVSEVARLTGLDLHPSTVWACQYANYARWDLSVIFGLADFART